MKKPMPLTLDSYDRGRSLSIRVAVSEFLPQARLDWRNGMVLLMTG